LPSIPFLVDGNSVRPLPLVMIALALMWSGRVARPLAQGIDIESRRSEMRDHYSQLLAIHDAVVRGDIEAIRRPATELAYLSVPIGSPFGSSAFGAAIRDDARRAARETTVTGAARATVSIIRSCAGCHRANGAAIPADSILRRRPAPDSMADHVRAADEMLLGLLMPSDERWLTGADRLQSTLLPGRGAGRARSPLEDTIQSLTDRAKRSTTATTRASAYVQLLTTCADCHQAARR
jgi:mono/diheme cytochrome c family protein